MINRNEATVKLTNLLNNDEFYSSPREIRNLLNAGANPHIKMSNHNSLLHIFAKKGEYDLVTLLVTTYQLDINCKNAANETPLEYIINHENYEGINLVKMTMHLLKLGANPNITDQYGNTLLHYFSNFTSINDQVIELTTTYSLDINARNHEGDTPLQSILNFNIDLDLTKRKIMLLLSLGADPNTKDAKGISLLNRFLMDNEEGIHNNCIRELINNYHADTKDMLTPLKFMLNGNWSFSFEKAYEYISKGEDPNTQDAFGNTILHLICDSFTFSLNNKSRAALIELVNSYHADINHQNKEGYTPLQRLLNLQYPETLVWSTSWIDLAMIYVRLGANPNTKNHQGYTLLDFLCILNQEGKYDAHIDELINQHHAESVGTISPLVCILQGVWGFSLKKVMELVQNGADPNIVICNVSILHLIATLDQRYSDYNVHQALKDLVEKYHANINLKNRYDETPLQYILNDPTDRISLDTIMDYVRLGADANTRDIYGYPLLHRLASIADDRVPALLEELVKQHSVNINCKNKQGKTALEFIIENVDPLPVANTLKLMELGANGYEALSHKLVATNIKGCNDEAIKAYNNIFRTFRSNYLNLLILLSNERNNQHNFGSIFKYLPKDILLEILSYLDFEKLQARTKAGVALAQEVIFDNPQKVTMMKSTPGGINVFQQYIGGDLNKTRFIFFKSANIIFRNDYNRLKEKHRTANASNNNNNNSNDKELAEYKTQARTILNIHLSLYKKPMDKKALEDNIKDTELYKELQPKKNSIFRW